MTTTKLNLACNKSHRLWSEINRVSRFNAEYSRNVLSLENHRRPPPDALQFSVFVHDLLTDHRFSYSWNIRKQFCKLNLTFRHITSLYDVIRMLGFHQVHVISEQSYFHNSRSTARKFHVLSCFQIILNPSTPKLSSYFRFLIELVRDVRLFRHVNSFVCHFFYLQNSFFIYSQQVTRKLEVYKNRPNALYINYTTIIKNTQIQ